MSFLGNIVDSIGGDRAPPPPLVKPPSRPASANSVQRPNNSARPASRPGLPSSASSGLKRKAEDDSIISNGKLMRPNGVGDVRDVNRRPQPTPLSAPKVASGKPTTSVSEKTPTSQPSSAAAASKPPPAKGSYAELMARAKQTAGQKQAQVGVIKHQERKKDRLSKAAERRRAEQEKARGTKPETAPRPDRQQAQRRSTSPVKKDNAEEQPSRSSAAKPTYRGTMGTASSRSDQARDRGNKQSRYDEYLGTDEEDDSDIEDEGEDYGSENSSDMEAGMDELDIEESKALRVARDEDLREQALENQLKRDKDERRRKLMAMAKKHK